MKRIIVEDGQSGFEFMLGEKITIFCAVYIYTGVLAGVNDGHIELDEPKIVYETGELLEGDWKDAQQLPSPWRVQKAMIESWGPAKC